MFKKSIPLTEFREFNHWTELFDKFCCDVKDEDILEDYSDLLEVHYPALHQAINSDRGGGYSSHGLNVRFPCAIDYENVRVVVEGQPDGESISFSIEIREGKKVVSGFLYAVMTFNGVSIT